MPAIVNIAASLAFGSACVLAVPRSDALRREYINWVLLMVLAFESLVFTPVATFLFRFYPQWSMLYGFDPQINPGLDKWVGLLSLLAVMGNFGAALAGYHITRWALIHERRRVLWLPMAMAAVCVVVIFAVYGGRITRLGDYDSFWQGQASVLLAKGAGWLGLLSYAGAAAVPYWMHTRFAHRDPSLVG